MTHFSPLLEHLDAIRLHRFFPLESKYYRFETRNARTEALARANGLIPDKLVLQLSDATVKIAKGKSVLATQTGLADCKIVVQAKAFTLSLTMEKMYFHFGMAIPRASVVTHVPIECALEHSVQH
jgi:hypothetical protein